jgi:hypothetical protein
LLQDSAFLQGKINKIAKKQMKFTENPFFKNEFNVVDE